MKILQCHNLYQLAGGEDSVAKDERELLEAHGHEVIPYILHNDAVDDMSRLRLAAGTIWSRKSVRELREIVRREKPEIAHFHNTLPLMSPSAYYAVRAEGAAVVQTLHNYRLLCPKATFFRDNQICEDCLHKKNKWPAIKHSCYRDNRAATAAVTAMLTVHGIIGTYRNQIDAYIACSEFTRDKMTEGGYPGDHIHYKPNFLAADPGIGTGDGGYAMYLGRLSPDKGIEVLVKAWDHLDDIPLQVVGKGPMQEPITRLAEQNEHVTHHDWVEFEQLGEILSRAACLILPTLNYEGFPRVIVEAFAHGVPVVTTNLGAMGRVIVDGKNGRHIEYGDAEGLARIVRELMEDAEQRQRLRQGARRAYEDYYTAEINYQTMMTIYRQARERFERSPRGRNFTTPKTNTPAAV
ncbi:MAG: glycosyltransferase [Planctomycetota bacterium]